MQSDDNDEKRKPASDRTNAPSPPTSSAPALPAPLKRLFDSVPLITYPANELPIRAPRRRDAHKLYIFTSAKGAEIGAPSFNPSCLKWQTFLKFCNVPFHTVPSTNHASPAGSLPFLLPAAADAEAACGVLQPRPVQAAKLRKWVKEEGYQVPKETEDPRYEAYMSLVDINIRNAWVYTLYLHPVHLDTIAKPLYIHGSTNPLVRRSLAHTLHTAATSSLLQSPPSFRSPTYSQNLASSSASSLFPSFASIFQPAATLDAQTVYKLADNALSSLSQLLGEQNEWFFGQEKPGLFDASVFAYTYLILNEDGTMGEKDWSHSRKYPGELTSEPGRREMGLRGLLREYGNLVRHARRIRKRYYRSGF